jgi:hypothetical protein
LAPRVGDRPRRHAAERVGIVVVQIEVRDERVQLGERGIHVLLEGHGGSVEVLHHDVDVLREVVALRQRRQEDDDGSEAVALLGPAGRV